MQSGLGNEELWLRFLLLLGERGVLKKGTGRDDSCSSTGKKSRALEQWWRWG